MGERKHELTDADILWIAGCSHPKEGASADSIIAALPSRQPVDPDAGLGKLPWAMGKAHGATSFYISGELAILVYEPNDGQHPNYDLTAVSRMIFAAPDGVKLARAFQEYTQGTQESFNRVVGDSVQFGWDALYALAAKVIATADGTDGSAA